MFFSTYVLTKKGPLAKIWLAAHWDKKLTRNDVKVVDLNQTVVQIVHPVVPIALRTSGELLVGVVRIYALKVKHLLKEATEAAISLRIVTVQVAGAKTVGGKNGHDGVTVTMDIAAGRGAGAEDLCEADFDSIADLLKKRPLNSNTNNNNNLVGSSWFAVDSSQLLEEDMGGKNGLLSQTDDEIANMRADLMAFGDMERRRAESSNGSKKSSTVSSIEKARASGVIAAGIGQDLDIGLPLPAEDDLLLEIPLNGLEQLEGIQVADPFDLPNMLGDTEQNQPAMSIRIPKKKILNILDTCDTVITKEELKKMYDDQNDIVNAEMRHGPVDDQEERDRTMLRLAEGNITRLEPLSHIPNAALRAAFGAALKSSFQKIAAEMEASRASEGAAQKRNMEDDLFLFQNEEEAPPALPLASQNGAEFEYVAEQLPEMQPVTRKRGRGGDDDGGGIATYSTGTLMTCAKLQQLLKKAGSSVPFQTVAKGGRRVEVARMFVDVLQLASHDVVNVKQAAPFAEIQIHKTGKLDTVATAVAAH